MDDVGVTRTRQVQLKMDFAHCLHYLPSTADVDNSVKGQTLVSTSYCWLQAVLRTAEFT